MNYSDLEYSAKGKCEVCKKSIDIYEDLFHLLCGNCEDEIGYKEGVEILKSIIIDKNFLEPHVERILDGENVIGFQNQNLKTEFFKGVRFGIDNLLFWLCESFGDEGLIEYEKIGPRLLKIKTNDLLTEEDTFHQCKECKGRGYIRD